MSDLTGGAERSRPAKIALRSQLITARRGLSATDRQAAASRVQSQILAVVRREQPAVIAAYVPVGGEPGGADLPLVLARRARVLLPVLLPDGDLDWAFFDGSLDDGPRGLREPAGPRLGVTAIAAAELVLVPALAVDSSGVRMGRGGGSYDRALGRLSGSRRPLVLALLHDGELVDAVPAEPHDQRVDGVITPRGGLSLNHTAEWTK